MARGVLFRFRARCQRGRITYRGQDVGVLVELFRGLLHAAETLDEDLERLVDRHENRERTCHTTNSLSHAQGRQGGKAGRRFLSGERERPPVEFHAHCNQ